MAPRGGDFGERRVASYNRGAYTDTPEKTYEVSADQAPLGPFEVLLLEDDRDLTETLTEALSQINCKVTSVTNGADGVRHIMATDFEVIICDMVMPTLPGDMFFLAVEKTKPHLCKRFLFMTGHKADKRWDDFARSKGCLILWKPFPLHVFLESVGAILAKNRRAEAQ